MLSEIKVRTRKANSRPGLPLYTGDKLTLKPQVRVLSYSGQYCQQKSGTDLDDCLSVITENASTWVHVEGLHDIALMKRIAKQYQLHPLTLEDILNVEQRPKIEEFDNYIFITLKILQLGDDKRSFLTKNLSLVLGSDFVLSFQDDQSPIFDLIRERIINNPDILLRKKGSDYLVYRLIDTVIDQYFFVLEELGEQLEKIEELIIADPTKQNARTLYNLKKQMLSVRKVIWPVREVLNHLMNTEETLISAYTKVYLRDVHDHAAQAMDIVETFREMLTNMLDIYLSYLSYRMNEIMKVLTIITTIFIPISFIASIYGMNFVNMPELHHKWSYPIVLALMAAVAGFMLYYYRRKKWL